MFLLSWVRLKAGRRYGLILAISSVTFDSTRDPSVLCPVRLVIDRVTIVCSVCVLLSGVRSDNFSQSSSALRWEWFSESKR